jgi:hypothetical protein
MMPQRNCPNTRAAARRNDEFKVQQFKVQKGALPFELLNSEL